MTKQIDFNKVNQEKKKENKYGSSSQKAPTFQELEYLRFHLNSRRDSTILIGVGFAGMRIGELIQCRLSWLSWALLENESKKMRVLAITIPDQDKNIVNLNAKKNWECKTKTGRVTYILDETLSEKFIEFYKEHPKGICEFFKTKNHDSIRKNITQYIIGTQWLSVLREFHREELLKKYRGVSVDESQIEKELDSLRSKKFNHTRLSAHALRSACESMQFYKYKVSLDISSSLMGHSLEIANKHYIAKTEKNIKMKLAQQVLR